MHLVRAHIIIYHGHIQNMFYSRVYCKGVHKEYPISPTIAKLVRRYLLYCCGEKIFKSYLR